MGSHARPLQGLKSSSLRNHTLLHTHTHPFLPLPSIPNPDPPLSVQDSQSAIGGERATAIGDRSSWSSPTGGCGLDSPTSSRSTATGERTTPQVPRGSSAKGREGPASPAPPPPTPLGLRLLSPDREPAEDRARRSRVPTPFPPRFRCRSYCPEFGGSRVPPGSATASPDGASAERTTQSSRRK